jgi:hypothetical protein
VTTAAMAFYIQHTPAPYVDFFRTRLNNQDSKIYLILDHHWVHNNPEFLQLNDQYGVVAVWLPRHSIHCLRPLDLHVFSSFKPESANLHASDKNHSWRGSCSAPYKHGTMPAMPALCTVPGDWARLQLSIQATCIIREL